MDKQNSHIFAQYLNWIIGNLNKIIIEAKESRKFKYKIISWQKGKNIEEDRLIMRVVGTHTNVPLTPLEIYNDDELIKGFSPSDVKIIATLALSCKCNAKYELLLQEFRGNLDDYFMVYGTKGLVKKLRISVDDLSKNMELIDGFSPQDAFKIGRAFAENQIRKEKKLINAMKKLLRGY